MAEILVNGLPLQAGDVVAVRGSGLAGNLIRFAAALHGEPNLDAHIAVLHHYTAGVPWGIEGRPGGTGWVDMRGYLRNHYTVTNVAQPKTSQQRLLVTEALEVALHTDYDWSAIAADAAVTLDLPALWAKDWKGKAPGHFVCSSLAAYGYFKALLAHPALHSLRETIPGDWTQFMLEKQWLR